MRRDQPIRRRWAVCLPAITHLGRPGPTRKTNDDLGAAKRSAERLVGMSSVPLGDDAQWMPWTAAAMTGEVLLEHNRPRAYVVDLEGGRS